MNDWKCAITLAMCCCIYLTVASAASADFVGVTTVIRDDPDTAFLCTEGNGIFVPGPLTVCNIFVGFDDPADRLLSVANADLQVYNGDKPDVFFQHPFNFHDVAPLCSQIPALPDLICDSFVTIGLECEPTCSPIVGCSISTEFDWDSDAFNFNGHAIGGWATIYPSNGQGDAGTWPDMQVLFLQSSVAQGLSLSGDIDIFWKDDATGDIFGEVDVPIECAASCGSCPTDTDGDGDTDAADLAVLLGNWGACGPGEPCECLDNDTSGSIDAFDLAVLLGNWGPCL